MADLFALDNAWVIPLIPAASFFLILLFGKRMPKGGSEIGIAALALCFGLAIATNIGWFRHVDEAEHEAESHATEEEHVEDEEALVGAGRATTPSHAAQEEHAEEEGEHTEFTVEPVTESWTWWESGDVAVSVGMLLDGPAVLMLFVVTLISLLVHIYSTDYVAGDRRFTHYFAFLSLFTASMLGLIMSYSTIQLLVCWELVGVCSFVLIGHWWEEKANSDAALKAFITNRVGDVGLICGVSILFFAAGQSFDILTINSMAAAGEISHLVLLVASLSLLAAVMSKSGQFILHTWLPDAMAGPTPVSALIHAATMVVAGIYMVGRLYPVFFQGLTIGDGSLNALAVVGGITVLGGAGLAFVQDDIKKVLAYSTVSQLGYMVMALGVGAWTAAFFHLFTHAFFKACLFLGSGSVAHAVHSFDMKTDMGGLRKWMPHTHKTFIIGSLALAGIPPLAGFWSKDEILAGANQLGGTAGYDAFVVVGLLGAFMTAAYMFRCVHLTFWGEFRGHGHPHESGPRIVVPLWILAGFSLVAGLANVPNTGALDFLPGTLALRFEHFYEPKGEYFTSVVDSFAHPEFSLVLAIISIAVAVGGVAVGYLWWYRAGSLHGITERNRLARWGYTTLVNKYYFDHLYTGIIANGVKGPIARAAYWFNQKVIDGAVNGAGTTAVKSGQWVYDHIDQGLIEGVVNGTGAAAEGGGQAARHMQTGKVQQYAAWLFAGSAVLAGVFIIVI